MSRAPLIPLALLPERNPDRLLPGYESWIASNSPQPVYLEPFLQRPVRSLIIDQGFRAPTMYLGVDSKNGSPLRNRIIT